jgi:hypothetical protein
MIVIEQGEIAEPAFSALNRIIVGITTGSVRTGHFPRYFRLQKIVTTREPGFES